MEINYNHENPYKRLPIERGRIVTESAINAQPGEHVVFNGDIILKVIQIEKGVAYCESTTFYPKKNFDVPVTELKRLVIDLLQTKERISFKFSQWRKSIEMGQVDNPKHVLNFEVRTKIFDKAGNRVHGAAEKTKLSDTELKYGKIVGAPMMVTTTTRVGFKKTELTNTAYISKNLLDKINIDTPPPNSKSFTYEEVEAMLKRAYTAGMINGMAIPGRTPEDFKKRKGEQTRFFDELKAECV